VKQQKQEFDYWLRKNKYYYQQLQSFYQFVVPIGSRVLHVNCKNGYVLAALNPSYGVGIDMDEGAIATARERYPQYQWHGGSVANLPPQRFDYIILTSATMEDDDIQNLFVSLKPLCTISTRIIVDACSYVWEPILWLTQKTGLRRPTQFKNWISRSDVHHFLYLAGCDVVTTYRHTMLPIYIPLISAFLNSVLIHVPLVCRLALHDVTIARLAPSCEQCTNSSVSVIIPCRNERGNIEAAVTRCPQMGVFTEIIFVEGHSRDNTLQEIERIAQLYPHKNISWYQQDGKGKGDAVRKGFTHARGEVLMILDADLTVPPEELPKFFDALVSGKGELINGTRLIYGLESNAMWFLSVCANFFFRVLLSWLMNQKVKDTLCGTKVVYKSDYNKIAANRAHFGTLDPFGDFDLLFGAARLNLKIVDMPIHYKSRTYGTTQINRFWHGWILVGMSMLALRKLKLR
jgi:hypothetical protein